MLLAGGRAEGTGGPAVRFGSRPRPRAAHVPRPSGARHRLAAAGEPRSARSCSALSACRSRCSSACFAYTRPSTTRRRRARCQVARYAAWLNVWLGVPRLLRPDDIPAPALPGRPPALAALALGRLVHVVGVSLGDAAASALSPRRIARASTTRSARSGRARRRRARLLEAGDRTRWRCRSCCSRPRGSGDPVPAVARGRAAAAEGVHLRGRPRRCRARVSASPSEAACPPTRRSWSGLLALAALPDRSPVWRSCGTGCTRSTSSSSAPSCTAP